MHQLFQMKGKRRWRNVKLLSYLAGRQAFRPRLRKKTEFGDPVPRLATRQQCFSFPWFGNSRGIEGRPSMKDRWPP
jgi:hypothetical protein